MKTLKLKDGVIIRECMGGGVYSIVGDNIEFDDLRPLEIRFAITGNKNDYTMSFTSGRFMISTLLNSDHILTVQDLYKVLDDDSYVVLYDTNYSVELEVFQGDSDNIPLKYMNFVITRIAADIIEGKTVVYIIEIC